MRWLTATTIRPDSSRQPCAPAAASAAAAARVHSVASFRVSRYTDGWSRCSRPLRSRLSMRALAVPAAASCARVTTPCCRDVMSCSTGQEESRCRERGATPDDRREGDSAAGFACMADTLTAIVGRFHGNAGRPAPRPDAHLFGRPEFPGARRGSAANLRRRQHVLQTCRAKPPGDSGIARLICKIEQEYRKSCRAAAGQRGGRCPLRQGSAAGVPRFA
jgi:hypothetical protein